MLIFSRHVRVLLLLQFIWALVVLASLTFNVKSSHEKIISTAAAAAEATINRDVSIRSWAASKGGVYVPPTLLTPSNRYLNHPQRDVVTQQGLELTLLNPAYLMRDIQENSPDPYGVRTRLTSLNPLNPINLADDWETQALERFDGTLLTVWEATKLEGEHYLRMIRPFVVEPACMSCHEHQGYQVGEMRGGITASIPLSPYLARYEMRKAELYLSHFGVWLLGFLGLVGVGVREQKRARQRHLHQKEMQLAAEVFEKSYEGILITDADANIVNANQAFELMSGYSKQELVGKNPRVLKSDRQRDEVYKEMWQALADKGHWKGELWNRKKNGQTYAITLSISAINEKNDPGQVRSYLGLCADITRIKESEAKLRRIAHFDLLTGLPNRLLLTERLQTLMVEAKCSNHFLAVAFLDLDDFKHVNERSGHELGDQFLLEFAMRLRRLVPEKGLISRIGGDEFVLVLNPLSNKKEGEPLLNDLLHTISEPIIIDDEVMQVTGSIGVTFYPSESEDADQLLRDADQAMYAAKQEGKNCISYFDPREGYTAKKVTAHAKEVAVGLSREEFALFFQPKIHTRTEHVIGAEALIRWHHPDKGLLPPAEFLPLLEQHAVMLDIGRWVLSSALKQLEKWREEGIECPLSINLTAAQLQEVGFLDELATLLGKYPDVEPKNLELEVLETTAVEDLLKLNHALRGVRALGVLVSIDDFGTGYSSLSYLKQLPVDTVKIDQSFVRDLLEDPEDLAIVKAIISMASAFRLNVIAEGVETRLHSVKLMELGCDQIQGYAVSHPLPSEAFSQWIKEWELAPSWTR